MSDLTQLSQLKAALSGAQTGAQPVDDEAEIGAHGAVIAEPKIDKLGRSYATGKLLINGREAPVYFARPVLRMLLAQPFVITDRVGQFDVWCTVAGGGLSGQAGAVRHGISKALTYFEPSLRPALKSQGFLTRDSRVVERKKYGKAKARRSFQFSKR